MTARLRQFLSILAGTLAILFGPRARARDKVVAYVPNWIDLNLFSEIIDYSKITHINIAFENPVSASGDLSFNNGNNAVIAKAHASKVKVLVSIGGGSASEDKEMQSRYFHLLGESERAGFVGKVSDYVASHGFDGLDVDLEGPAINRDYGTFIEGLASALKPRGKVLTAALSQGYGGKQVPDSVLGMFDFINIMAYDATGDWNANAPGQHSSFEFAESNVDYWLKRGLAKSKAVLGVPFYGYGFGKAFRKGEYSYSAIVANHPGAENVDQIGNTIWYNGIPTIKRKANYVVSQGLGGMMIWSLDSDVKGEQSLLSAIHDVLKTQPAVTP